MATTKADILKIAPELSSVSDDTFSFFITEAGRYINQAAWGEKANFAHALYTAHLLTMSSRGASSQGAAGPVTAMKLGEASINFGQINLSGNDAILGTTTYGSQFLSLRKTLVISPIVLTW